jgi:hypothetical protein
LGISTDTVLNELKKTRAALSSTRQKHCFPTRDPVITSCRTRCSSFPW